MRKLVTTKRFERDVKRARKRGKDLNKLFIIVAKLQKDEPREPKHRPRPLSGDWKPFWDCHIEPDWLLIYRVTDDAVYLVGTGTHADLF